MPISLIRSRILSQKYVRENFARRNVGRARIYVLQRVPPHLRVYYDFCLKGLAIAALRHQVDGQFFLGFAKHMEALPASGYKILIQHEQTLLSNKMPQDGAFPGSVPENHRGNFLVRLFGPETGYFAADTVVDYSKINLHNVLESSRGHLYRGKAHYIAPLLGETRVRLSPSPTLRVSTMFGSPHLGRRAEILSRLEESGLSINNIQNYSDYDEAFAGTAILLNYRQFSHFQTLEELRILPALMRGVVTMSERTPLWDVVPYAKSITPFDAQDIIQTLEFVKANYSHIWEEIFLGSLPPVLRELKEANRRAFESMALHDAWTN